MVRRSRLSDAQPHEQVSGDAGNPGSAAGPTEVREEDAFDVSAVHAWLCERDERLAGCPPPQVHQFSGGASNLTYLLSYPGRDLVLRRPPPGTKAASAHDMAREHRIQAAIAPTFGCVPKMVGLCEDERVIGSEFYVMERLEGTILRRNPPAGTTLSAEAAQRLCESALDLLSRLHALDPAACGLADLGRGEGYVRRQVDGWTRRYEAARTWNVPSFKRVTGWLSEHAPADCGSCVIHNDFRLDNLVLAPKDPARVVGVLDWEMATIGDPLMDLGGALAYWVQRDDDPMMKALRRQPTHLPGMLSRAEMVEGYAARTGREIVDFRFYEVFGLFRLAGIIQQIYRRYHLQETRNPAFRHYWLAVHYLSRRCEKTIDRGAATSPSGSRRTRRGRQGRGSWRRRS